MRLQSGRRITVNMSHTYTHVASMYLLIKVLENSQKRAYIFSFAHVCLHEMCLSGSYLSILLAAKCDAAGREMRKAQKLVWKNPWQFVAKNESEFFNRNIFPQILNKDETSQSAGREVGCVCAIKSFGKCMFVHDVSSERCFVWGNLWSVEPTNSGRGASNFEFWIFFVLHDNTHD